MSPLGISKATATEYAFILGKIPNGTNIHDADILRLNIFSIALPGVSLTNTEMPWEGSHVQYHIGGITFDPLNINFIVDSEFENWKTLFRWLTYIANNKDIPSQKPDDYVTDANIIIYDNFSNPHTFVTFKNIWIQSLGELTFSIRDGETHIECNAIFYYDRYEIADT